MPVVGRGGHRGAVDGDGKCRVEFPSSMMITYRFADLELASSIDYRGLLPAGADTRAGQTELVVELLDNPPLEPPGGAWFQHWRSERGDITLSVARRTGGYLLRFPELADVDISDDGGRVGAWARSGCDGETLNHLLLDQVLPRVLAHRGRLVLHASAVDVGGRAVAFVGETGRGKSTMAAGLHAAGWPLLGDDALLVATKKAIPSAISTYRGLRLKPPSADATVGPDAAGSPMASYSGKCRVEVVEAEPLRWLPLSSLWVLAPPPGAVQDDIEITRLSAREACMEIIRHSFQLDVSDRELAGRLLSTAGALADGLPVYELVYPRDYVRLPEVHSAIIEHLPGSAGHSGNAGPKE